jgi:hypothetical protein
VYELVEELMQAILNNGVSVENQENQDISLEQSLKN